MEQLILTNIVLLVIILIGCAFLPDNYKLFNIPLWYNPKKIISFQLDSKDTSQQISDIYSLSHITHGILFYFLFKYFNINCITGFILTIIFEIMWEIFENTQYIIKKYRKKKEYKNYDGDSIVNIIGDLIFTIIGYYIGYKSTKISVIYLVLSEIILIPLKANFLHLSIGSLL